MAGVVLGFVKKYGFESLLVGVPVFGYVQLMRLEKKVKEKEEIMRIMFEDLKAQGRVIVIDDEMMRSVASQVNN
ncbi:unnamed protein product [Microthlaspi erraticum]|uniref:Uncharacterized protein n=1 Tax=Microthlaspi erraticum TaxID=1685480 RepID=A0A6D2J5N1_9BRAS|nr:unnamed protein product [Microthlaspi erraticum]